MLVHSHHAHSTTASHCRLVVVCVGVHVVLIVHHHLTVLVMLLLLLLLLWSSHSSCPIKLNILMLLLLLLVLLVMVHIVHSIAIGVHRIIMHMSVVAHSPHCTATHVCCRATGTAAVCAHVIET